MVIQVDPSRSMQVITYSLMINSQKYLTILKDVVNQWMDGVPAGCPILQRESGVGSGETPALVTPLKLRQKMVWPTLYGAFWRRSTGSLTTLLSP